MQRGSPAPRVAEHDFSPIRGNDQDDDGGDDEAPEYVAMLPKGNADGADDAAFVPNMERLPSIPIDWPVEEAMAALLAEYPWHDILGEPDFAPHFEDQPDLPDQEQPRSPSDSVFEEW